MMIPALAQGTAPLTMPASGPWAAWPGAAWALPEKCRPLSEVTRAVSEPFPAIGWWTK